MSDFVNSDDFVNSSDFAYKADLEQAGVFSKRRDCENSFDFVKKIDAISGGRILPLLSYKSTCGIVIGEMC